MKDYGEQLDEASRKTVEDALADARTKLESKSAEEMNQAAEALEMPRTNWRTAMCRRPGRCADPGADGSAGDGQTDGAPDGSAGTDGAEGKKEDVVDADFKEVRVELVVGPLKTIISPQQALTFHSHGKWNNIPSNALRSKTRLL